MCIIRDILCGLVEWTQEKFIKCWNFVHNDFIWFYFKVVKPTLKESQVYLIIVKLCNYLHLTICQQHCSNSFVVTKYMNMNVFRLQHRIENSISTHLKMLVLQVIFCQLHATSNNVINMNCFINIWGSYISWWKSLIWTKKRVIWG